MTGLRTVRSISALMRTMPAFNASAEQRAAWLGLKAEVFAQLASQHRAMAAEAEAYATAARELTDELRGDPR